MSFRHTFVTDFIYQASDEVKDANKEVKSVFVEYADMLSNSVDKRGYGYYSGMIKDLSSYDYKEFIDSFMNKLKRATKVPFRITFLMECGPQITYEITPNPS
jgi:hypothetical protein